MGTTLGPVQPASILAKVVPLFGCFLLLQRHKTRGYILHCSRKKKQKKTFWQLYKWLERQTGTCFSVLLFWKDISLSQVWFSDLTLLLKTLPVKFCNVLATFPSGQTHWAERQICESLSEWLIYNAIHLSFQAEPSVCIQDCSKSRHYCITFNVNLRDIGII